MIAAMNMPLRTYLNQSSLSTNRISKRSLVVVKSKEINVWHIRVAYSLPATVRGRAVGSALATCTASTGAPCAGRLSYAQARVGTVWPLARYSAR